MDENYEKRGYLLEDFRLFHLKDDRGTKVDYLSLIHISEPTRPY